MRQALFLLLLPIALLLVVDEKQDGPSVATFNIRNYPESKEQEQNAFAALSSLNASLIAVQEITDTARFRGQAIERLGTSWKFYASTEPRALHQVGLLIDSSVYDVVRWTEHRGPVLYRGARPALMVWAQDKRSKETTLVVVLHLKAGSGDDDVDTRAWQLGTLKEGLKRAVGAGDRVVVLGDFNSTTERDRANIESFANTIGLAWRSRDLGCTHWSGRREGCTAQALDHVLASFDGDVEARGPCALGCEARESCPTWVGSTSDHCPVVY